MIKAVLSVISVALIFLVALIPINYLTHYDRNAGFLELKPDEVIADMIWNAGFYTHIVTGGISLVIGWIQFLPKLRQRYVRFHRFVGLIYVVTFLLCSLAGVVIAFYATGGWIPGLGFGAMGAISFYITLSAFTAIKNRNIKRHENMMIYSYASCFAAVTFRLWILFLTLGGLEYMTLYKIAAWMGWVPNLLVVYLVLNMRTAERNKSLA
jgi:uncharacterized membrane protein YozB (DUF420 family)